MTRKEMAHLLGISTRTLRRKIKSKGLHLDSGLLDVEQQKTILESFGFSTSIIKGKINYPLREKADRSGHDRTEIWK